MKKQSLWKRVLLVGVTATIGAAMIGAPVSGHYKNPNHLYNKHVKPKADRRYIQEVEQPWAVVNVNATLARGSGVSSSVAVNPGFYRVFFKRSVIECAFGATIGNADSFSAPAAGFVTVVGSALGGPKGEPSANGVFVSTFNAAGTSTNRAFHLTIHCQDVFVPSGVAEIGPAGGRRGPNANNDR